MKILLPILILILISGCPSPQEDNCGQRMILVDETCECIEHAHPSEDGESCDCDTLYHWDDLESTCVLDTVSNNFSWVIDTLGDYGTQLNDVEVVSADNIWVVGEIVVPDSSNWSGPGNANYNAARWNGESWQYFNIHSGAPLYSIHFFNENDIWVTKYSYPTHWDGSNWTMYNTTEMGIDGSPGIACWGTSSSNMYFVGRDGAIVHYDGAAFIKIEQGYDTDYVDIVGSPDGEHIYIMGAPIFRVGEWVVLDYSNDSHVWKNIPNPFGSVNPGIIERYSMDLVGDILYIPTEEGLWTYSEKYQTSKTLPKDEIEYGPGLYMNTIAVRENNIFYAGLKMDFLHFNGLSYKYIDEIQYDVNHLVMKGGDYNGDVFAMVGYIDDWQHGIVARGYRH
jgi:hypothetical protein